MRRATAVSLLASLLVLVPLSHLDIQKADDSWLLLVTGRPVDVSGRMAEAVNRITRRCGAVQAVQSADALRSEVTGLLAGYSPPDSATAQITGLWRQQDWILASVRFDRLEPAVVLIRQSQGGLRVVPNGIWSGPTHPFRADAYVRRYLARRVPAVPSGLLDCADALVPARGRLGA